jgi:hypothetical protein
VPQSPTELAFKLRPQIKSADQRNPLISAKTGRRMGSDVMVWKAPLLGVVTVFFGLSVGSVHAKTVRYEINGQRFSYSTRNRAEVAIARERINAANAAAAARVKANAELAANPLVRIFGSKNQKEAKAAEANLAGTLARAPSTPEPSRARKESRVVTGRSSWDHSAANPSRISGARQPVRHSRRTQGGVRPPRPEPSLAEPTFSPKIEAIVFDFASGIRTVHRADGIVEEEAFEPAAAEKLKYARRSGGPEIKFVNEPNNMEVDATGDKPMASRLP